MRTVSPRCDLGEDVLGEFLLGMGSGVQEVYKSEFPWARTFVVKPGILSLPFQNVRVAPQVQTNTSYCLEVREELAGSNRASQSLISRGQG